VMAIQLTVLLRAAAIVQRGERAQATALENAAAARDEAQRANRAKNDFLAVMSHELRTPLNAIIGYGSMLRDGIPDPPTPSQRQQVERIGASAKHLLALIDEVLTLSRLELGRERITPTTVAVGTLVEEAAAMMEPDARKKGLALSFAVPEEPITMVTDAGKLRQALVNLLGNAVKFTDTGGVCIRARTEQDGDEVVFEVEDVVDQPKQMLAGPIDPLKIRQEGVGVGHFGLLLEHLAVPDDRVQRRAQLVGHGRQEVGLVQARLRKLGVRLLEGLEQPSVLDGDDGLIGEGL